MIFYMCCYVLFSVDKLGALVIVKRISTAQARKICVGAAGVVVPWNMPLKRSDRQDRVTPQTTTEDAIDLQTKHYGTWTTVEATGSQHPPFRFLALRGVVIFPMR